MSIDKQYILKNLCGIIDNIENYTPEELSRTLFRLSNASIEGPRFFLRVPAEGTLSGIAPCISPSMLNIDLEGILQDYTGNGSDLCARVLKNKLAYTIYTKMVLIAKKESGD